MSMHNKKIIKILDMKYLIIIAYTRDQIHNSQQIITQIIAEQWNFIINAFPGLTIAEFGRDYRVHFM